ncbi:MAG: 16S rRNA (uracil(1498)-N(3))-methyltransferase [Lachnospiraceae bacterium]|jgi:16S rRNA (uracil1498-N3)-methyltransferase|nr:16S rRNA (uracil(1498)-N(3))-methyltransferase [Lachnospiraceae bacterium]
MYHFFVPQRNCREDHILIDGQDVNHIKNVLRMKPGQEIIVYGQEDQKEYLCEIESLHEDRIYCKISMIKDNHTELSSRITLYQALPKLDKMELIIQKTVELGVHRIVPVVTARSIVKLDDSKAKSKINRWQQIAQSAAKQAGRAMIPEIANLLSFQEALAQARRNTVKLLAYECETDFTNTKSILQAIQPNTDICVFIGPEGGFTPTEVTAARSSDLIPITLGRRILRTETAGMTVLSWIVFCLEE